MRAINRHDWTVPATCRTVYAATAGLSPGASGLRQILAALDSKQQALMLGHAVPMPITIRPRDYGPELFAGVRAQAGVSEPMTAQEQLFEAATLFWLRNSGWLCGYDSVACFTFHSLYSCRSCSTSIRHRATTAASSSNPTTGIKSGIRSIGLRT